MSDPQIGLAATFNGHNNTKRNDMLKKGLVPPSIEESHGLSYEISRFEKAINGVNILKPAFVIITGDMVQDPNDLEQINEVKRICKKLDDNTPIFFAPGNCDVGNSPTHELLTLYRERFGKDYYSFDHEDVHLLVLNTPIIFDSSSVEKDWEIQLDFIVSDLEQARGNKQRIIVFGHHPLFGFSPIENDSIFVIPSEKRFKLIEIFNKYQVEIMFAGHWHKNNYSRAEKFDMIISGPVGVPMGNDPSGIRIIEILNNSIKHSYHDLNNLPDDIKTLQ